MQSAIKKIKFEFCINIYFIILQSQDFVIINQVRWDSI